MAPQRSTGKIELTPKACPLCASEFGCGFGSAGCWCESLDVAPERLLPVRAVTDECLCPRCLQAVADRPEPRP
jgi:cysteine-rich CWC protein